MVFTFPKTVIDTLSKLSGEKSTLKDQAIVKLYTADFNSNWIDSNLTGILTLSIDRSLGGALFFRLYDTENFKLLFQNELYYNFINSYKKLQDGFYYYDVVQGYIGFGFPDEVTAEAFRKSIFQLNKKMEDKELKKIYKEIFEKKQGGIFSKITNFFTGSSKNAEKTQAISKPTNVTQNMSIKFDFEKGKFDLQSLSPEMKRIFKKAGIEKKDLLDKEFAPLIFEKILMELNQDAESAPQEEQKQVEKNNNNEQKTAITQNKNVPPPPPNLNIPPPPSINIPKPPGINVLAPPKLENNTPVQQNPAAVVQKPNIPAAKSDLLAEIRKGVNLKTVNNSEKKDDQQLLSIKINQDVEESLTLTLAKAILERRKQITKDNHTSSEESPWSDSD